MDALKSKSCVPCSHICVFTFVARTDRYVNKKPHANTRFSRMSRAATAESILIKFGSSTPWADVVIYLKQRPNWSKGWGGGGVRNFAYPIDFAIGF